VLVSEQVALAAPKADAKKVKSKKYIEERKHKFALVNLVKTVYFTHTLSACQMVSIIILTGIGSAKRLISATSTKGCAANGLAEI
jgi:hypothetical protein